MKPAVKVLVTGAAGQIAYSLVQPLICGAAFGMEQPVHVVLFDLPQCENVMKGVAMEMEDCCSPVYAGVTVATKGEDAFKDIDFMIGLAGLMPLGQGMNRIDLIKTNKTIYEEHGKFLDTHAKKTVKVLIVANPCNLLTYILMSSAPSIPKENFMCMTRLDHNRTRSYVAGLMGVPTCCVYRTCVWGNHSSSMVPDITHASAKTCCGKTIKASEKISEKDFTETLIPKIRQRALAIVEARGRTSALSSAMAAMHHLNSLVNGTPEGDFVSMGVLSDGSYGAPKGVFFGFPCTCKDGKYTIVQGLDLPQYVKDGIKASGEELVSEIEALKA